jgi:hypothetical protein
MDEFSEHEMLQLYHFIDHKYPVQREESMSARMGAVSMSARMSEMPVSTIPVKPEFSFVRRWGISPMVNVNNISGHKAWVMVSPTPMTRIQSLGIEKAGKVDFSMVGEYKCQQSPVLDHDTCTFTLDTSNIYYTVFFECGSAWKMLHDNMKLNTSKTDIHLVERHVLASVNSDFVPGHKVVS